MLELLDHFPRFPLAHLPTPLEPLKRLSSLLGGPEIYIKRDDCTGLALGGNKTRKLEFLVADALQKNATVLVSEGGVQSNHVRQTAAAAVKANLECALILKDQVFWSESSYLQSGNLLLDRLLGASVHLCEEDESKEERTKKVLSQLIISDKTPYHIPVGGSTDIGGLGYAQCALELIEQADQQELKIDHVVLASGSGGTQGGFLTGLAAAQSTICCTGIGISKSGSTYDKVSSIYQGTSKLLSIDHQISAEDIILKEGYESPGYGLPNDKMIEAVTLLARLEGIILDPVYSGKAMAGLIDLVRKGEFKKEETVVFIHTGGTPALFTYSHAFEELF